MSSVKYTEPGQLDENDVLNSLEEGLMSISFVSDVTMEPVYAVEIVGFGDKLQMALSDGSTFELSVIPI